MSIKSNSTSKSKNPWLLLSNDIKKTIFSALEKMNVPLEKINAERMINEPPDPKFGEFSTPIAFSLAKILKKPPIKIANDLISNILLKETSYIEKVQVAGGGHVNFYINWEKFSNLVINEIIKSENNYGNLEIGKDQKVIIEHTSANPNKPLHLGTLRCAVLGDLISRIYKKGGYTVEIENYMDNLGRQIAVLVWRFLKDISPINYFPYLFLFPFSIGLDVSNFKIDYFLGLLYADASQKIEKNPELEEEVREIIKLMEEGNNPYAKKADEIVEKATLGQLETAWRMNIFYDLIIWESDVIHSGIFEEVLERILKSKNVYKVEDGPDAGCIVVDMSQFGKEYEKQGKPYKIIVRSNNVPTYTGRDIGLQAFKLNLAKKTFNYRKKLKQPNGVDLWETNMNGKPMDRFGKGNIAINVVGIEQAFPQQVVYYAMKAIGYEEAFQNSYHLSFEHVWLPDQKFSGRKGTWIGFQADVAIEKAVELAYEEVKKRHETEYDEKYMRELAEKIGVGAIKYYIAKFKTERKIIIKWEEVLNFEGDSAPYIQYAAVRTKGILNKFSGELKDPDPSLLQHKTEKNLMRHLAKFPNLIKNIIKNFTIHLLPEYLLQLAEKFSDFYHACPVLNADNENLKISRLALVKSVQIIFKIGLEDLMGIEIPERM
ncbi:MAG: arginine--tRNA ligase [Candidatus Helarchaeota archaeon]